MHSPKDPSGVVLYCFLDPLIKNQDVNARYLGSYPPFWMVFKMAAVKKAKYIFSVISASYHQLC